MLGNRKVYRNESGSALVIALFLIVFITIIGVALLTISSNSLKQVDHERTDQAIYYIAEAGINVAKIEIEKQIAEAYKQTEYMEAQSIAANQTFDFQETYLDNVESNLKGSPANSERKLEIKNFSEISGQQTKAVVLLQLQRRTPTMLKYSLKSTGYIGESTRQLNQNFVVRLDTMDAETEAPTNPGGSNSNTGSETTEWTVPPHLLTDTIQNHQKSGVYVTDKVIFNQKNNLEGIFYFTDNTNYQQIGKIEDLKTDTNGMAEIQKINSYNVSFPSILKNDLNSNDSRYRNVTHGNALTIKNLTEYVKLVPTQNIKNEFTLNIESTEATIYIDTKDPIHQGMKLNIIGSGTVNLIFTNQTIQGFEILDKNNSLVQLNAHFADGFSQNGDIKIDGNLFFDKMSTVSNKLTLSGSLYYGGESDFSYNGNSHSIIGNIYSPNANMMANGNVCVVHQVLAKNLTIQGNAFIVGETQNKNACPVLAEYKPETPVSTILNKGPKEIIYEQLVES